MRGCESGWVGLAFKRSEVWTVDDKRVCETVSLCTSMYGTALSLIPCHTSHMFVHLLLRI